MGGFLAAWLIPHAGWRSVFLLGSLAPLLLAVLLTRVPESIRFMVARRWPAEKIRAVLLRIAAGDEAAIAESVMAQEFRAPEGSASAAASPLGVIFAPRYLASTLMLWLTYFMGLLLFYMLTSWMPTLVRDAGYSLSQASIATALFPLGGGFGAVACGWLMDRRNSTRVVAGAYLLTAVLMLVLSASTHGIGPLMCATFFAGLAMNGAQTSMPVLAASSYPTEARASGVSWMLGAGRMGGVLGAFSGGVLMQAGFSMAQILLGLAATALVAALALFFKDYASRAATALAVPGSE
jgi:MFS transporter, AAHS family, 4-hydroxybenzoate transporter